MNKGIAKKILFKGYRLSLSQTSTILIDDCEIRDKERPNASCKWEYIEITNEDLINLAKIKFSVVAYDKELFNSRAMETPQEDEITKIIKEAKDDPYTTQITIDCSEAETIVTITVHDGNAHDPHRTSKEYRFPNKKG